MTIIKTRGVIIKNDEIFLVKCARSLKFMLPWWKQEEDETLLKALKREIIEETWVVPDIWKYLWFREYLILGKDIAIHFLFEIKNVEDFENIKELNCTHSHEWIEAWFYNIEELKNNNVNIPDDLEEIFYLAKKGGNYNYLIK